MSEPRLIDGREMAPPEPFEATMTALDTLQPGEELTLLLYCQPQPLYETLRRNGYVWNETWEADGTNVIRIRLA